MASSRNQRTNVQNTKSKKDTKRLIIVLAVILAAVMILATVLVASNWKEYQQLAANRKVVATCNGYDIPYEELRFITMFYKDSLEGKYGKGIWDNPETAEKYRAELEELVHDNLNQNYMVLSTCRYLGIKTEGQEVDEYVKGQIKELKAAFSSTKEYKKWLEEHWMSENYMKFSIGVSFLESAIYYTLLDNGMYTYSQKNIAEYIEYVTTGPDYIRTIHIYIENADGEDPAANLAQAQAIAEELQAITDEDERKMKFNEYIGSTVNDDFLSVSGDGYYFIRGEMDEDYEDASFALEIGDVSDAVVCSGGNFIIMRLTPEENYVIKNCQTMLNNYHSVAMGIYMETFREDCKVVFNEYGQSLDLVAIK